MSGLVYLECLDYCKKVEELQEKTRVQEEVYEKEVKMMKKNITMTKAELLNHQKIFAERIKDLQDKYLIKIRTEQKLSENLLFELKDKLRLADDEKKRKIDERFKVVKASEKIKESLTEELDHLTHQKKTISNHLQEISSKITQIQQIQTKNLQTQLKTLKKTQEKEIQDLTNRLSEEKASLLNLTSSKTDLLHKLEVTESSLQDELKHSKSSSSSKLSNLKTNLHSVNLELKETEFRITQVLLNSQSREKVDQVVLNKSKLLESLHDANRDLWSRYEKLNKMIF
jgi:chromosome segregation ATPase